MKCLAVDTTTDIASVAAADEHEVLAECEFGHKMDLSRRLMPAVLDMLKARGLNLHDFDSIGVDVGPGSFTGLRIGVVTAKTLAQVLELPIVGMVSLDLLARDCSSGALVCPLVKVHRGEVYYAFYRTGDGSLDRLTEYAAGPLAEVVEHAQALAPEKVVFRGDAVEAHAEALKQALGSRAECMPSHPKAAILARLAVERTAGGEGQDPLTLMPFYVRRSTPEIRMADSR